MENSISKLGKLGQQNQAALKLDALIGAASQNLRNQSQAAATPPLQNVFFTTTVLGMSAISHVIEDQALTTGQGTSFYTCFQKFSRAKPQLGRYQQILAAKVPVYLFGVPDAPLWEDPYLNPIALAEPINPAEPTLVHNWFVILHNPQFVSMALLTRELPSVSRPLNAPDKLVYRNFEGFWTYDKDVINQVVTVLDDFINGYQAANAASPN